MGENSKIEWTDHTFNPWWGCVEVFGDDPTKSACLHCYARILAKRTGLDIWGKNKPRRFFSEDHWLEPIAWNRAIREAACNDCDPCLNGRNDLCVVAPQQPQRVFCASMADVFEDYEGPKQEEIEAMQKAIRSKGGSFKRLILGGKEQIEFSRKKLWALIEMTPNLTWLLLTKRPENMVKMTPDYWNKGWPRNVVAMTTVENQKTADERIPHLLRVPARLRGLSMEPLLGPVQLARSYPEGFAVCSKRNCGHFGEWDAIRQCVDCDGREENQDNGNCAACNQGTMRDICPKCETSNESECYEHPSDFAEGYEVLPGIHWVITGGESGPGARPTHPDWFRSVRDQCVAAGVPYFHKQNGEFEWRNAAINDAAGWDGKKPVRIGKAAAGRLLDGKEWSQFPA